MKRLFIFYALHLILFIVLFNENMLNLLQYSNGELFGNIYLLLSMITLTGMTYFTVNKDNIEKSERRVREIDAEFDRLRAFRIMFILKLGLRVPVVLTPEFQMAAQQVKSISRQLNDTYKGLSRVLKKYATTEPNYRDSFKVILHTINDNLDRALLGFQTSKKTWTPEVEAVKTVKQEVQNLLNKNAEISLKIEGVMIKLLQCKTNSQMIELLLKELEKVAISCQRN